MCKRARKLTTASAARPVRLSKKQIDFFFDRFDFWCQVYRLNFTLSRRVAEAEVDAFAHINASCEDGLAIITLNPVWPADAPPTNERLNAVALHEATHLLLWPLDFLRNKVHTDEQWMAAEHGVVAALERVLTSK